jgi:hypothetical protein
MNNNNNNSAMVVVRRGFLNFEKRKRRVTGMKPGCFTILRRKENLSGMKRIDMGSPRSGSSSNSSSSSTSIKVLLLV